MNQATLSSTLKHPSICSDRDVTSRCRSRGAYIALVDAARQPDEGTATHIWQLLMAGQLAIILFFAIRWPPQAPSYALTVLAFQGAAAVAALAPFIFFIGQQNPNQAFQPTAGRGLFLLVRPTHFRRTHV